MQTFTSPVYVLLRTSVPSLGRDAPGSCFVNSLSHFLAAVAVYANFSFSRICTVTYVCPVTWSWRVYVYFQVYFYMMNVLASPSPGEQLPYMQTFRSPVRVPLRTSVPSPPGRDASASCSVLVPQSVSAKPLRAWTNLNASYIEYVATPTV